MVLIYVYTLIVLLCGVSVSGLVRLKKYAQAAGIVVAVIIVTFFMQETANFVFSHRGYGFGGYCSRY